ncbi:lasso peptide biosynthesis B2 protein [Phormidium sp. CCY1219]|uniref:lasso peptide biosynthesis B2 protein n=1 Tax=Phormidium sp. CCY1219 TaxID=2886104 RepID=UPI002D1EA5DA|nr:lasso peptide biosynthesis B2 protein [Phormidium sp. CCY1219]MEB3826593.1 lasso peptide biosynthesis B2 protein [Phormidium sp. CCY1219]
MDWLKLAIRKSRSFWGLEESDRWLVLQAFGLLVFVAISLRLRGLKQTQAAVARKRSLWEFSLSNEEKTAKIVQTTRMVRLAARYCQPWANCLKKSLVLWGLLRRQGIDSELRIGVRREEGKFEAHAWVECEGFVLNDSGNVRDRFATFDRPIDALPIPPTPLFKGGLENSPP